MSSNDEKIEQLPGTVLKTLIQLMTAPNLRDLITFQSDYNTITLGNMNFQGS
jgi:hypothetical protein